LSVTFARCFARRCAVRFVRQISTLGGCARPGRLARASVRTPERTMALSQSHPAHARGRCCRSRQLQRLRDTARSAFSPKHALLASVTAKMCGFWPTGDMPSKPGALWSVTACPIAIGTQMSADRKSGQKEQSVDFPSRLGPEVQHARLARSQDK